MRVRWSVVVALAAVATAAASGSSCDPQPSGLIYVPPAYARQTRPPIATVPAAAAAPVRVVLTSSVFAFEGGRIDLELRQAGNRVVQVARNRYIVPVVMWWEISDPRNLDALTPLSGVVVLPPADRPTGDGAPVELATLSVIDPTASWNRGHIQFKARFGDPRARPEPYAYALPYKGTFAVLQGFHGAFSHRGSNEFAVDFDCPVATTVRAARPGIVVVTHDGAQGSGTTPEFLEYSRVNFVLVLHDDGTLGEYMHLSPSGVEVQPGQHVARGEALALSGNTGFSTTPHLHFQVMTAANDGIAARSFPFDLEIAKGRSEEPVQGRMYPSWE